MKYYDLFAGIGGFHMGLTMASDSFDCIGACEKREASRAVYAHHWPDVPIARNADDVERLPRGTELLCAGFPCQPFSLAGRRLGFADKRGGMFAKIPGLAADRRVPYLLLENVTGLLSNDSGRTFATVLGSLDACGYDAQWLCITGYGAVPQTRDRVFIVCNLRGFRAPEVLPVAESDRWDREARQEARSFQGANTVTTGARHYAGASQNLVMTPRSFHLQSEPSHAIVASYAKAVGYDRPSVLMPVSPGLYAVPRSAGGMSDAGVFRGTHHVRRLTPLECERLMGFPDGHTVPAGSDTNRYEILGDSVIPHVVAHVAKRLIKVRVA